VLSTGRTYKPSALGCKSTCRAVVFAAWLVGPLLLSGCALVPDVRSKPQLINPFPQIQRVAILPFVNQSEDPTLSGERVAMAYANELQNIRGFEVLPIGAVKIKMAEFNMPLGRGEDFQAFARFLGVDVVLIGAVTDYSAYYPPRMAMKVNWYAANPGFHPIQPGYGLPWGTREEKKIPRWVHQDAQRALAAEQMKSQSPVPPEMIPIMPEDRPSNLEGLASGAGIGSLARPTMGADPELANLQGELPPDWPDPRGFIPDGPLPQRPEFHPQHDPIISYMRSFNGHDEDLTQQLEEYFYFRDDARFGGWQAYLQRSEDFIRFCCYQHLSETLISRGGQDKSRLIFRWPIDRYER
jgi:hypothetical protein